MQSLDLAEFGRLPRAEQSTGSAPWKQQRWDSCERQMIIIGTPKNADS
jgi:hypothetical protein